LDIPDHPAHVRPQLPQLPTHPLELFGVRVTTRLHRRLLAHPHVRLPQRDAPILRRRAQLEDRPIQQLRVRGMGDVLLLHRRIDVDLTQFRLGQVLLLDRHGHRLLEQRFELLGPDPLTPLGHTGGMDRQLVPHVAVAAERLPVGVLDPLGHDRLVRLVERVLEVVQPHHQPRGLGRGAVVLAVQLAERVVERSPVDLPGQLQQWVGGVEQLIEVGLEQQQVVLTGRLRLHPCAPFCKVRAVGTTISCNLRAATRRGSP